MKKGMLDLIKILEDIENNWGYRDLETAFYLYARFGKTFVEEKLDDEDIDEIDKHLEDFDGSLFNEDINDYVQSNFDI